MNRTCQYIPHGKRDEYERNGWTIEELPMPHAHYSLLAWKKKGGKSKYAAVKTQVDGITFDSRAEARRYSELKLLERSGDIRNLQIQPKFAVTVNGVKVCTYVADFAYFTEAERVIEDVKSPVTAKNPVYRLKKKLVEALYPGVRIMEIGR